MYQEVTKYFNPRSPHGERRIVRPFTLPNRSISIHALLTESDKGFEMGKTMYKQISIHALLTESDSKYHQIGPIVSV